MVFLNRKFECERYVIANHFLSAEGKEFFESSATVSPVKCLISQNEISERDETVHVPAQLLKNFEKACEGHSERFKLMRVVVCCGVLSFDFADLKDKKFDRYRCYSIRFRDYSGTFSVYVDDDGHKTVHEFDFYDRDKYGYDENGNRLIATFREWRGDEKCWYSNSSIILIDGKQYLNQNIYDY